MSEQLIKAVTKSYLRDDIPEFRPGDNLKVYVKIKEGDKTRIQIFEGLCISRHGGGVSATYTVRKISYGVGVERVFPVNSPRIIKVELIRPGKVRRSKIYYVRDKIGKAAKIKELIGPKANARVAFAREVAKAADAREAQINAEHKAAAKK